MSADAHSPPTDATAPATEDVPATEQSLLPPRDEPDRPFDSSNPASPSLNANATDAAPVDDVLGLSTGDRWFVLICAALLLVLLVLHWLRLTGWGLQPVEIVRPAARAYDFRIDVNDSTWVEWMQLDEIGEALARRIVADRAERGPFRGVEDVGRVKGIGPKTLEAIRPWLTCAEESTTGATP